LNSGYLLDTSVFSALAPGRTEAISLVSKLIREKSGTNFVSVVTITEIQQGVSKLQRLGGNERAARLSDWLNAQLSEFADRIIQIDKMIAFEAGKMSDAATAIGRNPGSADIYIAATAKVKDFELLTRNVRHFAPLGIRYSDPFENSVS
jgi:toxin FitB